MNSVRWMICCFVPLVLLAGLPLRAEDEVVDLVIDDQFVHEQDHEHPLEHDHNQQILDRQKVSFERHVAVRITELKRVCDLEEKQVKKLEVAAKGAVEEAMKQFQERFPQLKGQARQRGRPRAAALAGALNQAVAELRVAATPEADAVAAEAEIVEDQPEAAEEDLELPPLIDIAPPVAAGRVLVAPQVAPAQMIWNLTQNFQMEPSEVANTDVWRNAVQHVLTDPQKESYRKAQTERRLFKRQTVVDRVVASVDRRLFLSAQQRKDLAKVIHAVVGENLDQMVPNGAFTSDSSVAAQVVGQIPRVKLEGVLDPAQIEGWNDLQKLQQPGVFFNVR